MNDRKMLKWAPFASVCTPEQLVQEIQSKKSKRAKPELIEDELEKLNQQLFEYFSSSISVQITFYENYDFNTITGVIKKIDMTRKAILINNKVIYASQIISIKKEESR